MSNVIIEDYHVARNVWLWGFEIALFGIGELCIVKG
jgi:hypothetical protein